MSFLKDESEFRMVDVVDEKGKNKNKKDINKDNNIGNNHNHHYNDKINIDGSM